MPVRKASMQKILTAHVGRYYQNFLFLSNLQCLTRTTHTSEETLQVCDGFL